MNGALKAVDQAASPVEALPRTRPRELALTPTSLPDLLQLGGMLWKSGLMPPGIKSPEGAASVVLKGMELGLPPMAAIEGIAIIQGKPTCSAHLLLGLIKRDYGPGAIRVAESTNVRCTVEWREQGWAGTRTYTFDWDDAIRANLVGKDIWKNYPAAMLRARAISAVAKMAFPECVGGLYVAEELGGAIIVTDDGDVLPDLPPAPAPAPVVAEATFRAVEPEPPPPERSRAETPVAAVVDRPDDWTVFWKWTKSLGLANRDAVEVLIGGSTKGLPIAELRRLIEAALPEDDEPGSVVIEHGDTVADDDAAKRHRLVAIIHKDTAEKGYGKDAHTVVHDIAWNKFGRGLGSDAENGYPPLTVTQLTELHELVGGKDKDALDQLWDVSRSLMAEEREMPR